MQLDVICDDEILSGSGLCQREGDARQLVDLAFKTGTPEQRDAVETWCPPGMEIPAPRERPAYPGEDEEAGDPPHAEMNEEIPFEDADTNFGEGEAQLETEDA